MFFFSCKNNSQQNSVTLAEKGKISTQRPNGLGSICRQLNLPGDVISSEKRSLNVMVPSAVDSYR